MAKSLFVITSLSVVLFAGQVHGHGIDNDASKAKAKHQNWPRKLSESNYKFDHEWFKEDVYHLREKIHKANHHQPDENRMSWKTLNSKIKTAGVNLKLNQQHLPYYNDFVPQKQSVPNGAKQVKSELVPGQSAQPFTLDTLNGSLSYPSEILGNKSIVFHTFDNRSAFVECLWTSPTSLKSITSSPDSIHYVFMSPSIQAKQDAVWMQHQLNSVLEGMSRTGDISKDVMSSLHARFHFVTTPTYELGNWIPAIMMEWACQDHGCGLSQAVFKSNTGKTPPIVLKRLDARYDWLPSPGTLPPQTMALAGDGCTVIKNLTDKVALVVDGNCSFSTKVSNMEASAAAAVIVYSKPGEPVKDMNCEGAECDSPPSISATMVPYSQELLDSLQSDTLNATFQTTPSENFYFAIDAQGKLAEIGWLLYPSFQFFVWQAQWFDFRTELLHNLSKEVTVVPIFNETIMEGHTGAVKTIHMPALAGVSRIELDVSLSCPGLTDEDCPPWDHTVQLYMCCDESSPLCGMELGRWITPFRRRIGRWLTDVTPLIPLFTSDTCTFTMQTAWWAQPWKPSLNLRIHDAGSSDSRESRPQHITPLFRGGTFNQTYNAQYKPVNFTLPKGTQKVLLYAVITGHGSDNNGCGEFCVTSHHFVVNGHANVNTFTNAGTPTGCADRTPTGVEPNEHGTWLYGRDGWCDGRDVDPWVVDVTSQVNLRGSNSIAYFGWFNGTDPNPTSNPGSIIMYSYLVDYV